MENLIQKAKRKTITTCKNKYVRGAKLKKTKKLTVKGRFKTENKMYIFKISIIQNKVSIMHIFRVILTDIISERKGFEDEINTIQIQTMISEVKNSKLQAK